MRARVNRVGEIPASFNARAGAGWNASSKPMRFLIVDDSASFLAAAQVLLEREGLTIAGVASNGAEARRQAEALRPDVALVDISLGEESGIDLARELVEDGAAGDLTVILISTHSEEDFADLIARCPAAGFLPKAELSADAIRRILEEPQ
jgi:two-component system, NarL family, nitrate/nitrite response regulator NarL